jgi:hypothetical protein
MTYKAKILGQLKIATYDLPLKVLDHIILCKYWTKKLHTKTSGENPYNIITSQDGT